MPTWLANLFDAPPTQQRSRGMVDLLPYFAQESYAGPRVTEESSLRSTAVYGCVRIISESIASLPLVLYRRDGENKARATGHPLYRLLHDQPNPAQTALEFREMLMVNVLLRGTAFAEKELDGAGRIRALWPLKTNQMEAAEWQDGMLWYAYRLPDQSVKWLPATNLLIIRGMSGDGMFGYSPIQVAARQAVGLALATEEHGARFFGNGARPGGLLRHPGTLTDAAYERLKQAFTQEVGGLANAHRMKILEEGMEYTQVGIPNEQAQFLETRAFQVRDIARVFRVPPHMLADLDRATFSNIEQQSLEFVIHTLRPWLVRIEQAIARDLIIGPQRNQYFARHIVEGLLRGDTQTRMAAYQTAIMTGHMSPNEARILEDQDPVEGLDYFLAPLNMAMIDAEGNVNVPANPQQGNGESTPQRQLSKTRKAQTTEQRRMEIRQDKVRAYNRFVRLFEDAAGRLVRRETNDIRRAANRLLGKRTVAEFEEWLAEFYRDLRGVIPGYFDTLMQTLAEEAFDLASEELGEDAVPPEDLDEWIGDYLENFANVHAVGGERQLRTLLAEAEDEAAAADAVMQRMDGWEDNRASKVGQEQAFEAGNALTILAYTTMGVRELVWTGGDCPICQRLNGQRIPISGSFANEGDVIQSEDEDTDDFPVNRTIKHGPVHLGCDCTVVAG